MIAYNRRVLDNLIIRKQIAEAKEAGCIIDTPGIISQGKKGYELIQHIVSEFSGKLP